MPLSFDVESRSFNQTSGGVAFQGKSGNQLVDCFIATEALVEAFGAEENEASLLDAFDQNVGTITGMAAAKFDAGGMTRDGRVILKELDFKRPH